ncbi:hypothetical protein Clacol_005499 [Clathrus columnatus]|uniref:GST N-terminal domain-containing protein n=1 Tax=Clathrus columnatus TaxID=1419009 RepID=A0AAV5A9H8_9AGAM|nr:hypothetical protein Clacol_005499 [Clathrus columnatus]
MSRIPDANIYPNATGKAFETVQQHQAPEDVGSVPMYKEHGWPWKSKEFRINIRKKTPITKSALNPTSDKEFLKLSPKGLVPALSYKGRPIHESLVINEFLEEVFPDKKPLLPKDPVERAHIRIAIDHVSKAVVPPFMRLLQAQDQQGRESARQAWAKHVLELDAFKNTTSDLVHYEEIYGRYLRNEAQSEAAKAIREGRAIP